MPEIRPEYLVNLKGKSHPLYAGVLVCAHENGLLGIEVSVTQYPAADNNNTAVCQAIVTMQGDDGRERVFTEVGDANSANVGAMIAPHIIRMAATRAKGRALRDALALGIALVEEMGPDVEPETAPRTTQQRGRAPSGPPPVHRVAPAPQPPPAPSSEAICSWGGCGVVLSADEILGSRKWFGPDRLLCSLHGREAKKQPLEELKADPFADE